MRRRALLASLAASLTAAAGCLGDGRGGGGGSPPDDDTPTGTDGGTNTRSATDTPTRDGTDSPTDDVTDTPEDPVSETPTPPPASDAFDDFDCPDFEDTDRTVCYHEADPDTDPLVLTAEPEVYDPETGDGSVDTLDFVLYNRTEASVGFNPYDWGIERYDDGEWTHVAPEISPEPWTNLSGGGTFTWSLPTGTDPLAGAERRQPVDVALEPGVYAFHVSVLVEDDSTETPTGGSSGSERIELIALFRAESGLGSATEPTGGVSTGTGG